MNKPIAAASALMAATVLAHVIGGGPEFNAPVQASDLSSHVRAGAAVVWHGVTVMLGAMTLALAWLARRPNRPLEFMVSGIQLGFAGLFVWFGLAAHGSVLPMPQWVVFLVIPTLTYWGGRLETQAAA